MIVMPANSTGWFWHCLSRETGRIGHLYSPGANIAKPFPWFPYALDNGAFACWDMATNTFDDDKWQVVLPKWHKLLQWASSAIDRPRWAIVPDTPGNSQATLAKWAEMATVIQRHDIPLAIAVQDGMTVHDVQSLATQPEVIAIGGTDEFKWGSLMMWRAHFPRVHVLRCNSPDKLYWLEQLGIESCDGTGWNRGNRKQTAGLEIWARSKAVPRCDAMRCTIMSARHQRAGSRNGRFDRPGLPVRKSAVELRTQGKGSAALSWACVEPAGALVCCGPVSGSLVFL